MLVYRNQTFFSFLQLTQYLNKKKNVDIFLQKLVIAKRVKTSAKNIQIYFRAHQSFEFFGQNTWFFKNNGALSKFWYRIFHYFIRIIKDKANSVLKTQFYINHASLCRMSTEQLFQKQPREMFYKNGVSKIFTKF